jgi:hypothetical protein
MSVRLFIGALIALLFAFPTPGLCQKKGFYADLTSHDFDALAGQTLRGSIMVTSMSDEVQTLRIYSGVAVRGTEAAQDYQFAEDGLGESRSLLPWMTFSPNELTLAPKQSSPVTFEVNVPNDPSLTGSYWATIFIANEPTAEQVIQKQNDPTSATVAIKFVFRYAVRISVTMPGDKTVDATMLDAAVEISPEQIRMLPVFENKGNTILKPKVWIDVRDLTGKSVARTEPSEATVLPESKRILVATLDDIALPAGEYFITVAADYGGAKPVGARAKIKLDQPLVPKPKDEAELGIADLPPGIPAEETPGVSPPPAAAPEAEQSPAAPDGDTEDGQ